MPPSPQRTGVSWAATASPRPSRRRPSWPKVSRDHYVTEVLDKAYPQYQFAKHKGYGTKLHYEMLDKYGPCPEHRRSFLKKWEAKR